MAKRVGKEPEENEEYDFVPPDFDEDAFIHKEIVSFRTTSTLIVVGILAALLSWLAYGPVGGAPMGWFLGIAIVGLAFASLKFLYRALKFDISHYGRREWIGSAFLMFFTWLAFFMILLNPPFSDFAEPHVGLYASPHVGEAGQTVTIDVFVADNDRAFDPEFQVFDEAGATVASADDLTKVGERHFRYTGSFEAGTYQVIASTEDPAGHHVEQNMSLEVREQVLDVTVGDLRQATDIVFVRAPDSLDIWGVYADLDSDRTTTDDRVYFEEDEALGGWKASANFEGWQAGSNNFTIYVEEQNRFDARELIPGGIISAGPYEVEVGQPGDYDRGVPNKANPTTPKPRQDIPGIEMPLLIAGIVAVAVLRRK